jgi:adenine phosphoribosyltransferase
MNDVRSLIRDVRDFPKPGIVFRDITPVLADARAFARVVDALRERYAGRADMVVGIESRGFILGAPLAYALGVGLGVVRKPGKLPWEKLSVDYALEYGKDTLEMHRDAIAARSRIVLVDDLLATGGTAAAALRLIEEAGGHVIEAAFLVELTFLQGRSKVGPVDVFSLIQYDSE